MCCSAAWGNMAAKRSNTIVGGLLQLGKTGLLRLGKTGESVRPDTLLRIPAREPGARARAQGPGPRPGVRAAPDALDKKAGSESLRGWQFQ